MELPTRTADKSTFNTNCNQAHAANRLPRKNRLTQKMTKGFVYFNLRLITAKEQIMDKNIYKEIPIGRL